jgi:ketosteroid isomerase-like protein
MINPIHAAFDFVAFKRAFVSKDVKTWLGFFAEDAEWIEYKPTHPPKTPRIMKEKSEIRDILADVKASKFTLAIEDEVVGPNRAGFCVWCTFQMESKLSRMSSFISQMERSSGRLM